MLDGPLLEVKECAALLRRERHAAVGVFRDALVCAGKHPAEYLLVLRFGVVKALVENAAVDPGSSSMRSSNPSDSSHTRDALSGRASQGVVRELPPPFWHVTVSHPRSRSRRRLGRRAIVRGERRTDRSAVSWRSR